MQAPGMVGHLAELKARGVRVGALLALLLPAVLDGLAAEEEAPRQAALAALLLELADTVPLELHAQEVTQRLLQLFLTRESLLQSEAAPSLQQALRCPLPPPPSFHPVLCSPHLIAYSPRRACFRPMLRLHCKCRRR